jgi:deoxyuridine 5'-triphosphate nucleotidohydrolase
MDNSPVLQVVKLAKDAKLPKRTNPTDSGLDICFHSLKRVYRNYGGNSEVLVDKDELLAKFMDENSLSLPFGWRALMGTGLKATVAPGYEIQVRPRSGLALKQGLTVLNTPGTIDESYRDEISVILINLSRMDQKISFGERIAQLVVAPVVLCDVLEVAELD